MADKKSHIVLGALVAYKDDAEKVRYLYAGAAVPDSMPASELERLVAGGLIGPAVDDIVPGVALPPVVSVAAEPADKPAPNRKS